MFLFQFSYHEPHGVYYFNPRTKERQWDHPLDAEYKALVDKVRAQLSSGDLSEETSQIDSGIKSLQGTEEEVITDVSPTVPKIMDQQSSRFLAPIEKRGGVGGPLQPLDVRPSRRFEVTSYASTTSPPQIGLNIKTEDTSGTSTFSILRNENKDTHKGLTLSGTGSMFLKSRKIERSEIISSPIDIDRKFGDNAERKNPSGDVLASVGSPTVKSILRDSSLTDVRNRFAEQKMSEGDGEDRKIVRFNLEKSVLVEPRNSSKDSSDNDEDDDDEWDFNDGDGQESYVKDVKVIPAKVSLAKPTLKNQLSLDELRKPSLNKLSLLNRTFSTDSGTSGERSSLSTLFERQIDKTAAVKPLYDETDSESGTGSVKRFPRRIDAAVEKKTVGLNLSIPKSNILATDLEDEEEIEKTDIRKAMNERLQLFRKQILKEQTEEEIRIRKEMQIELADLRMELSEKNKNEIKSIEMNEVKDVNKEELEKMLQLEKEKFSEDLKEALNKIRSEHKEKMKDELSKEKELLDLQLMVEKEKLENKQHEELSKIQKEFEDGIRNAKIELESQHNLEVEKFSQQLRDEFEAKRKVITNEHRSSVEILQRNHNEILQDLERDLKSEEELLRKDHMTNLAQLKDQMTHELECERQRMKETGDNHVLEKIRCEKRLLEDKYRCLKEKYVRLKADVKMSLERRNRRREHQTTNTGSETERSNSHKHSIGNSENKSASLSTPLTDHGKPPAAPMASKSHVKLKDGIREKSLDRETVGKDKKFTAAAKYLSHIQQYTDDTTSVSQSDTTLSNNYNRVKYLPVQQSLGENGNSDSEAFRRNQENNNVIRDTPGRQRKKIFTRMKSASTSRLNSSNNRGESSRPCTPVENLRRQLQKLEDLEDQFPDNTLDTTYHLRYPFKDAGRDHAGTSSELEFFKHRIHMERDSVRRAKESLRTQRTNFRARQREIKQRHKSMARHTVDQLVQEEKELTEMEVNLHRTRALLGEKVIRLRHLEASLQRICDKDKPLLAPDDKLNKEDATISDLSSHSSSGFSSTDFASETNHGNMMKRKEMYQESSAIIQSLDNLNTEIREIWEILSKQQTHCTYFN